MGQGRNGQGHVGRASAWALLGAAALLVGTVMMGSAAFAADEPPTLGADAPTTTVAPRIRRSRPAIRWRRQRQIRRSGRLRSRASRRPSRPTAIAPGGTSTLTFTITVDAGGDADCVGVHGHLADRREGAQRRRLRRPRAAGAPSWAADRGLGTRSLPRLGHSRAARRAPSTVRCDLVDAGAHENTTSTLAWNDPRRRGSDARGGGDRHVDRHRRASRRRSRRPRSCPAVSRR